MNGWLSHRHGSRFDFIHTNIHIEDSILVLHLFRRFTIQAVLILSLT